MKYQRSMCLAGLFGTLDSACFLLFFANLELHSRVYGTNSETSDWDFIVVIKDEVAEKYSSLLNHSGGFDEVTTTTTPTATTIGSSSTPRTSSSTVNCVPFIQAWDTIVYTATDFQGRLDRHYLPALECFFLPQPFVLYSTASTLNSCPSCTDFGLGLACPSFHPTWSLNLTTLRSSISAEGTADFSMPRTPHLSSFLFIRTKGTSVLSECASSGFD